MKKKVFIDVPKPCHEDWSEMTPVKQGRHCGVCSKNIIDFTTFSDKELLAFLSTPQQNICGRFNNKQLKREISSSIETKRYSLPSTWLFGLSLLAGTIVTAIPISTYASPTVIEQSLEKEENKSLNGDSTRVIKGVVIDSITKENLIGVTVLIKDTKIRAATDFDGKFSLKVPENYTDEDITIEARYIGYNTKYVKVKQNETYVKVSIEETPSELTGEVVITEHCTTLGIVGYDNIEQNPKPTRWQRIKGFFKRLF